MSDAALIEAITREVMKRLATSPAAAPSPAATPAEPACACPPAKSSAESRERDERVAAGQPGGRTPETVRSFVAAGAARIGGKPGATGVPGDIARYIDHTLLKPDVTESEIRQICKEAKTHNFASVCVNPAWVKLCADELRGSEVVVCTVVGFPLGATTPAAKAFEARKAIREGAREVDMVINIGALKTGNWDLVDEDIRTVREAVHEAGSLLKVIIEATLLTDEQKVVACLIAKDAGADFVKTSTGFASGGATLHDVALMRAAVGPEIGVKASGGIRTYADAVGMIEAGATRIGASAGVRIAKEARGEAISEKSSGKDKY